MESTNYIQYALVAHGTTPIAEYSPHEGNFKQLALRLLDQIDARGGWVQSEVSGYVFHGLTETDRMVYMCLADGRSSAALRVAFLEDLKSKWRQRYGNMGATMKAYEKSSDFAGSLRTLFQTHNSSTAKKLAEIREHNRVAQDETTRNLNLALQRGEHLEVMEAKVGELRDSAVAFHHEASNVRRAMCWQKWRFYVLGGAVVLVIVVVLIIVLSVLLK